MDKVSLSAPSADFLRLDWLWQDPLRKALAVLRQLGVV
jgi:hypothetical protein